MAIIMTDKENPMPLLVTEAWGSDSLRWVAPEWGLGNTILPRLTQPGNGFTMLALTDQNTTTTTDSAVAATPYDPTEARRQRGLAIAAQCKIKPVGNGFYKVPSQSGGNPYMVTLTPQYPDIGTE